MIKLYNTLTRKKEIFRPIKLKQVGLYSCGPTVYNYAHIGNLRAYIFADILKKTLEYNDYKIKHVINITDVGHLTSDQDEGEDKIITAIKREGKKLDINSMKQISNFYTNAFKSDITKLNISHPSKWAKATEHVEDMISDIKKIEKNGYCYETADGIYFDTAKLKNYGKIAKIDIENLLHGARVCVNPTKKTPTDFALWLKSTPKNKNHIMQWDSPWGKGWPGWHIECSTMSVKYLKQPFDIHTGGIDHIPVHHTNEIAQAQAINHKPLANYWVHNEFLILDKAKMSKSKETFITLSTLIAKNFNPIAYRYLCLSAKYRSPLSFSWQNLKSSQNALNNLYNTISSYNRPSKIIKLYQKKFQTAINNDLDTPAAIAIMWDIIKSNHKQADKLATILDFDKVLCLGLDKIKKQAKIPAKIKKWLFNAK